MGAGCRAQSAGRIGVVPPAAEFCSLPVLDGCAGVSWEWSLELEVWSLKRKAEIKAINFQPSAVSRKRKVFYKMRRLYLRRHTGSLCSVLFALRFLRAWPMLNGRGDEWNFNAGTHASVSGAMIMCINRLAARVPCSLELSLSKVCER